MMTSTTVREVYAGRAAPARTMRSVEYDMLARVTARLRAAEDRGKPGFAELLAAAHDNRSLWIAFAADVAQPGNRLPETLRSQILYLARFTVEHSRRLGTGSATAAALIEINTSVMRGLRGETGGLA